MKISCLKDFILEIPEAFNPNDFGYDREQGDILDNLGEGTTLESKTISENFLNLFCYLRRIRQEDAELIQVANKKHFEKIIIFIQEKVDSCERRISSELFEVLSQVVTDKMSEKLTKTFVDILRKNILENISCQFSAIGNMDLTTRIIDELKDLSCKVDYSHCDDKRALFELENATLVLDMDGFKSYLRSQIGLEMNVEQRR